MATTRTQRAKRTQFVNRSQGWLGAVKVNREGKASGVTVAPGDSIYLTDEEIELTAEAHYRPEDSPFVVKHIVLRDQFSQEIVEEFDAAPLERVAANTKTTAAV